jgi:hypothetical protein
MPQLLHFVGVAPDQWRNALRVWGQPDYTHERATWSCMGEIAPGDTVILGRNAFPVPRKWRKVRGAHQLAQET